MVSYTLVGRQIHYWVSTGFVRFLSQLASHKRLEKRTEICTNPNVYKIFSHGVFHNVTMLSPTLSQVIYSVLHKRTFQRKISTRQLRYHCYYEITGYIGVTIRSRPWSSLQSGAVIMSPLSRRQGMSGQTRRLLCSIRQATVTEQDVL